MSSTRQLAALLLALVSGCATTRPAQPALRGTGVASNTGWRTSDDALSLNMRAIAMQLGGAGLKPSDETYRGFLTAGARATHGFDLPANNCVTLIAIASHGVHDMDAALYTPDGDLLAVDSQPDAHPTIQVCTGAEARSLYYALQVYEGAGSFLMVGFLGQQSTLEATAKLLGAKPAVARLGATEADGPGRVSAFRDGLQRRGFQPIQAPLRFPLTAAQNIRVALSVEPGQCYTAAGFALDGLSNVNLHVLDEEGSEIARDDSDEEDAGAQFCAERRAEYAAELHGATGNGTALLMFFRVDSASVGGTSGLWLGERPLAKAASAPLADAMAHVARRARDDGFKLGGKTLRSGEIAAGEVIAHTVALAAKRCARIEAIGGPGMRRLDLSAVDTNGHLLANAEGDPETTYVHLCSTSAREITAQVHAAAGSGAFALTIHEAPLSAIVPIGADEALGARLQQVSREARDFGYRLHAEQQRSGAQRVSLHGSEPLLLKLGTDSAQCLRAYVVSRESGTRGRLIVAGKPLDEVASEDRPARFCASTEQAKLPDPIELRLTSTESESDAWLMVLVR